MSEIHVLDCTLRDGGFYTQWHYHRELIHDYVKAADAAHIDYIEIGYRSPQNTGFAGALKFTTDEFLQTLPKPLHSKITVMLESSQFRGEKLETLSHLFVARELSPVTMVRIATRYTDLDTTIDMLCRLNQMGYETCLNLMAWPSLSLEERTDALRRIADLPIKAFYIADSYGSMVPDEIASDVRFVSEHLTQAIGLHLHNNLELAFANALAGIKAGATFIDASILGMGRGPGNLKTEIFLQFLQHSSNLPADLNTLIDFISDQMEPLHSIYQWGPKTPYVLSGFKAVHIQHLHKS